MNLANRITLMRLLLVPAFVIILLYYNDLQDDRLLKIAFAVFLLAAITDMLDGYIARTRNQISTLGSYLDPIADKFLMTSSFLVLAHIGLIPLWLTVLVVVRDIVILTGIAACYKLLGRVDIKPHLFGKLSTLIQIVIVAGSLIGLPGLEYFYILATCFIVASMSVYVLAATRQLRAYNNNGRSS